MKPVIAPSILAADFANLETELRRIEEAGAEFVHLDVMDGMFVPNISFGAPVIKSLRPKSRLVFDTHLMIEDPIRYIDDFVSAGSDYITIHLEAARNVGDTLRAISEKGVKAGLSIKPGTPVESCFDYLTLCDMVLVMSVEPGFGGQKFMPSCLEKIATLYRYRDANAQAFRIEVDGGITPDNVGLVSAAGADTFVAGSAVFGKPDYREVIDLFFSNIRQPDA